MSRRQYSDREKAEALAALDANEGDARSTARQIGVPYTTLRQWAAGHVTEDVTDLRNGKKLDLADRLEEVAHKLLDVLPDKMSEASLQQAVTSLAIAIDKMQLLRNQPTTIQQTQDLSEEERARRIAELLDRARSRQPVAVVDGAGASGGHAAPAVH